MHDRDDRAGEVDGDVAALVQVTQEAAEHRDDQLGVGTAEAPSLAQDELVGVPDPERLERDFPGPEVLGEKGTDNGLVFRRKGAVSDASGVSLEQVYSSTSVALRHSRPESPRK